MKAIIFPLAFLAAAVSAQSTACAANYVVEACLGTTNGQFAECGTNDYGCQCAAYTEMLVCFNNCPNDPRISTYAGQKQTYCANASIYSTSTSIPFSAPASTSAPATATNDAAQTTGGDSSSSATSTGSAASASKTNSAADLALNAGGILAAIAGVVAAVL